MNRLLFGLVALTWVGPAARAENDVTATLDPRGKLHIPIGIANTREAHLSEPRMQRWYAFDEGGRSGSGGWGYLRTKWNGSIAMPHGWAIAKVHLLLRDCLAYELGPKP